VPHVVSTVSRFGFTNLDTLVRAALNQSSFPSVPPTFQEAIESGHVLERMQAGTSSDRTNASPTTFFVRAHLHAGLTWISGIDEVGGQRGTILSSDLPEIPSGGFMKMALRPATASRTGQAPFEASGSPGRWLHRSWASAASTAPVGVCPSSPAALPPVLSVTPGIRVLRPGIVNLIFSLDEFSPLQPISRGQSGMYEREKREEAPLLSFFSVIISTILIKLTIPNRGIPSIVE